MLKLVTFFKSNNRPLWVNPEKVVHVSYYSKNQTWVLLEGKGLPVLVKGNADFVIEKLEAKVTIPKTTITPSPE